MSQLRPSSRLQPRAPRLSPKSAQRGFSLIEIIVVVVLIGGIVAFAASRILGGGDRAKVKLTQAQLQTVAEKIQQYQMDTGHLPPTLDALVAAPAGVSGWLGPYAKSADLNDAWMHPLHYKVPGDGGRPFDLSSDGADGRPGGDSVNADLKYE
ncbi:type II secretion system protein GspG [Thermomonas sp. S9]|uniref:General secretion pathway protein G n=1 Tax=Thermomonas haemolytica TaxID=141949 RepID=A0A4V2V1B0_9GAMM|nr:MULTISPECIES: type II secretion system protein GspG [Thermomonas]MCR6494882.1 type II secretion system protein GspG [Thermomonas sp. S9]TCT20532.1 general secretion pathway protein G [Thermomonas haemolytica]TNY28925.1 type II secretion system protein GspG [Thermomonas haemolytica]